MILDGKRINKIILDEVRNEVKDLSIKLKLVVIQVGDNAAGCVYLSQIKKMCSYVGYDFDYLRFDNDVTTDMLLEVIDKLNNDDTVTGIMIQLSLPNHIDKNRVINSISPLKDVDGLTDINKGKLFNNMDCLSSCTAVGIMELLDRYNIFVKGKSVLIIGRSDIVGKPLSMMMLNNDATVTVSHSNTDNLIKYTKDADIIVTAVGISNFITSDMVNDGVIIVDVGIVKLEDGICGDVDYNNLIDKCAYITPVPGGVGPMTIAMLARNILKADKMQNKRF